jgi:TBC1 domain family member 5
MHEVLAPLYYAVEYDSVLCPETDAATPLQSICSRNWVAADSWALFNTIMKGISRWYEWREVPDKPSDLSSHIHIDAASGEAQLKTYVAPIIQICNVIQTTLLKAVDPALWEHVQTQGVEPQIYGM